MGFSSFQGRAGLLQFGRRVGGIRGSPHHFPFAVYACPALDIGCFRTRCARHIQCPLHVRHTIVRHELVLGRLRKFSKRRSSGTAFNVLEIDTRDPGNLIGKRHVMKTLGKIVAIRTRTNRKRTGMSYSPKLSGTGVRVAFNVIICAMVILQHIGKWHVMNRVVAVACW